MAVPLTDRQRDLLAAFAVPLGYLDALLARCPSTDVAVSCAIEGKIKKLPPNAISDDFIASLGHLEAAGLDVYEAAVLPEDDRVAILDAVSGTSTNAHPSWDTPTLTILFGKLTGGGDMRDGRAKTLLAHDANDVLSILENLETDYVLDELLDALTCGIPSSDLAWRASLSMRYELGQDYRDILERIARVTNPDTRRLALLLASRDHGQRVPVDAAVALAKTITTGHDEIARYLADGMNVDEAIDATRAQAALDRKLRVTAPQRTEAKTAHR